MSRSAKACPAGVRPSSTGSPHSISRRKAPGFSDDDSAAMYQRFFRKVASSATDRRCSVVPRSYRASSLPLKGGGRGGVCGLTADRLQQRLAGGDELIRLGILELERP